MRYLYLMLIPAILLAGCESTRISESELRKLDWCSTPGKTLEQLGWVWSQNREMENHSLLLTDDYHFYFANSIAGDPLDDGYIIPASWDKTEDVQATQNMFEEAYNTSLNITNWEDYDYDPGGTEFTAAVVNFQLYNLARRTRFCIFKHGFLRFQLQED